MIDITYNLSHAAAALQVVHDYLSLDPPPRAGSDIALALCETAIDYLDIITLDTSQNN